MYMYMSLSEHTWLLVALSLCLAPSNIQLTPTNLHNFILSELCTCISHNDNLHICILILYACTHAWNAESREFKSHPGQPFFFEKRVVLGVVELFVFALRVAS